MKVGLIGYGSIGRRHVKNLLALGYSDITLLREKGKGNESGLAEEYDPDIFAGHDFDFIIISNPSTFHYKTALPFLKASRNLLIEKPLVFGREEYTAMQGLLAGYRGLGMVAYNMRFHPCILRIKEIIDGGLMGKPYSARFFVGQYLPDWRPGQDYCTGVSALKDLGGGVVSELIHEIDMALFLFGKPRSEILSFAGRVSDLSIETEDISEILYQSDSDVIISVHQDYLNRSYRRTVEIVGELGSMFCDLKTSAISIISGDGVILHQEEIPFERNDMYLNMMRYYTDCIKWGRKPVPDFRTALESVRIALEVKEANNL